MPPKNEKYADFGPCFGPDDDKVYSLFIFGSEATGA